jgi:hypothetical protein
MRMAMVVVMVAEAVVVMAAEAVVAMVVVVMAAEAMVVMEIVIPQVAPMATAAGRGVMVVTRGRIRKR